LQCAQIAVGAETENVADQRADSIPADAHAEIEHHGTVAGETLLAGDRQELFEQSGLANSRLAADIDRPSAATFAAGVQHHSQLLELRPSADQRLRVRSFLQRSQPRGARRLSEAADIEHPGNAAVESVC
jgi:hypothetical protein